MTSILFCACLVLQATNNQTDWSRGPGATGPVADFGSAFIWSDSVVYTSSGCIITMTRSHGVVDRWTEHVVENNSNIDGHGALRPADFDGDGDYDLAGAIDGLNLVRVYRNQLVETGVANFTRQVDVPVSISKYCMTWVGDFNRDSRPDIVVPGDSTFWFENNGNWSFTRHFIGYVDHVADTNFCDVGDVDNDGDMDVVNGMLPVVLWRNNGNGTFARESIYAGRRYRAKLGDLNSDGYLDLLQADWVFLNRGPGYPTVFPTTPSWQSGFARGEVDGIWITDFDSYQNQARDLLLCRVWGSPSTYAIYWYQNDGSGVNYTRHTIATGNTAHANGDAAIAEDMDLDGYVDVVGGYSSIGYFHQYPYDSFRLVQVDPSFGGSGGCHWVEVKNLCERPGGTKVTQDIMASGSGQFHWWENGLETDYTRHAWLVSSVLDAEVPSYWQWLKWNGRRAVGTELDLYVRTGATPAQCTLKAWQGPFPANSARDIDSVNILPYTTAGDRYFQYRVFMAGCNTSTPKMPAVLYDVWVKHERITHDVGVVAITSPAGAAPPGPMVPTATLRNFGTVREPVRVYFDINSSPPYQDYVLLPGGLPFADTTMTFRTWTATPGVYQARCSTWMATDEAHANDVVRQDFTVSSVDVGVKRVAYPWGNLDTETVIPAAVVRNFGATTASFEAWFGIASAGGTVYRDSALVTGLAPGDSTRVEFSIWPFPHPEGSYLTRCSTWIAMDGNHANDVAAGDFRIARGAGRWGWVERASLPAVPSGEAVKDGGWLVADRSLGMVFGAKGNKTADFYSYALATDLWLQRQSVPRGREGKNPYKGAAGCGNDDGVLYATKGNNTVGFFKYDAALDSWYQVTDVPPGHSNKKVKGGTDMACVVKNDTPFVYLLKGYYCEFFRYNTVTDTWVAMPNAPTGSRGRWDKGSWLVYDRDHRLYAHKAKYHELWAFDVATEEWSATRLSPMPYVGRTLRSKKSKDGGCGAWLNDSLYALKGGNTQEFWEYRPQADTWNELDTMPSVGSSLRKKRVKAGGDLVAASPGVLYAFKGNRTNEFWRYTPYPATGLWSPAAGRGGVAAYTASLANSGSVRIVPNPVTRGRALLHYVLPAGGDARLAVYDIAGRLLHATSVRCSQQRVAYLDLSRFSPGVYAVRLESGSGSYTTKLVVR